MYFTSHIRVGLALPEYFFQTHFAENSFSAPSVEAHFIRDTQDSFNTLYTARSRTGTATILLIMMPLMIAHSREPSTTIMWKLQDDQLPLQCFKIKAVRWLVTSLKFLGMGQCSLLVTLNTHLQHRERLADTIDHVQHDSCLAQSRTSYSLSSFPNLLGIQTVRGHDTSTPRGEQMRGALGAQSSTQSRAHFPQCSGGELPPLLASLRGAPRPKWNGE